MARKKSEDEPCGNWMDTYGDMVTLLLTFFVMLFSMSSVNEEKWQIWVKAFSDMAGDTDQVVIAPEGTGDSIGTNRGEVPPASGDALANEIMPEKPLPTDFNELFEYLKAYVEQNGMSGSVEVSGEDGVVYVRFQDNIFFNPDSAALKPNSTGILDFLGDCLLSVQDQILTVNINGHTADPGIADYRVSDWTLSSDRASQVAIYLEDQKGLDPQKLLPIGYGKNFPVAPNDTPEGREQNRRVDMMIVSNDSSLSQEDLLRTILSGTFDPDRYPESGGAADILVPDSAQEAQSSSEESSLPAPPPVSPPPPENTTPSGNVQLGGTPAPPEGEASSSGVTSSETVSPYADA